MGILSNFLLVPTWRKRFRVSSNGNELYPYISRNAGSQSDKICRLENGK